MVTPDRLAEVRSAVSRADLRRPKLYLVMRKNMTDEHVAKLEHEYRRFLVLLGLFPDEKLPISVVVDELWHAHLLFTREYARFSESLRGEGGMIHHNPTVTQEEREELKPRYFNGTLKRYQEIFGEEPSTEFWPRDGEICTSYC